MYAEELLVKIIANRLVATAICTMYGELNPVNEYTAINEGTIITPPPIPNRPERIPAAIPTQNKIKNQIQHILKNIDGVGFSYLDKKDVVRHKLVKDIIKAYEEYSNGNNNNKKEEKPENRSEE